MRERFLSQKLVWDPFSPVLSLLHRICRVQYCFEEQGHEKALKIMQRSGKNAKLPGYPKQGEAVDKATLPNDGNFPNIRATHGRENNSNL